MIFYATSNLLSINIYLESQGILRSELFYSIAKIILVSPSDRRSHDFQGFHKTFHFYNIIHKTDIDIDFHRYFHLYSGCQSYLWEETGETHKSDASNQQT